jgi:ABC-2 type transport system permease protein
MGERIVTMLRKEFRSVLRDPRMRMVIFGLPIIQCLIFGYAVTMDVRHVRLVIIDRDNTPASRALITRFTGSDYFDAVEYTNDEARARALIDAAEASAILQINARFGADLAAGRAAPVQLLVDGSDSNTARLVLNYSVVIATAYGNQVMIGQAEDHHPHARIAEDRTELLAEHGDDAFPHDQASLFLKVKIARARTTPANTARKTASTQSVSSPTPRR